MRGPDHCFIDAERWLARPPQPPDRDTALCLLATRYLAGHGAASAADLAAYTGLGLTDARRAVALAGDEVRDIGATPALPPPRLLGMFDPVLHGWRDRSWVVGPHPDVVTSNGMFRASALVDGRVAGVWTLAGGAVTLRPLRPLAPGVLAGLEAEAVGVLRFLGLPPAPVVLPP